MIGYMLCLDCSVKDDKELDACSEHELSMTCHVSFALQPVEFRICCKIGKLAGSISEASAGQSACCPLSFFQWTMTSPSVCPLEKTFRDIGICHADNLSFRARLESNFKRKNLWEQRKSGKLHMILCSCNNWVTVFLLRLVGISGLGQTKERKSALTLTMGLRIVTTKSVKTLRRTRLRRRVLWRPRSSGGAVNKYTFSKVSQIVFSQGFASAKCMYFRKVSQICISRNTSVSQGFANVISHAFASFAQIRKYGFAVFRKLSQAFAIHGFASFRKDSQGFANGLSQGFAKDSQVRKSWFFARIRNGQFADEKRH